MKIKKVFFAILFYMFLFVGCGRQPSDTEQEKAPTVDWKTKGFAVSEKVVNEQALWVDQYIPWKHEGITCNEETEEIQSRLNGLNDAVCFGDKIYRLYLVTEKEGHYRCPVRCLMEVFDVSSMESTVTELSLEQAGIERTWMFMGMDVTGDWSYAFHVLRYSENEDETYVQDGNRIVYLSPGEGAKEVDLRAAYLEKGIIHETYDDLMILDGGECICDASGNSYIRTGSSENPWRNIYVLDSAGKLVMSWEGTAFQQIYDPMKTEEGDLIFMIQDSREHIARFVWFDAEAGQLRILAELSGEYILKLYGMMGNEVYYQTPSGIVRWDIATGVRQLVFGFSDNGISDVFRNTILVLREGEPPILRLHAIVNGEEEDWLVRLSTEPVEHLDAVHIVCLTNSAMESARVKNSVAVASRKNPNDYFVYENSGNMDVEDYRTRIIAEMMAGGGPEVLYVSCEDMELLQKIGLLADLRDLVKEETLSRVLPGVLELGTVDGTLVGMAPEIRTESILIGESTWSGDSWTWDDVLDLMESGKLENRLMDGFRLHASWIAVMILIEDSLDDSFLIDWENGESHFEDERFIRILEDMGKYVYEKSEDTESVRVRGGGSLMTLCGVGSINEARTYEGTKGAEGSHYIGYPSEHGNGNYLYTDGVIVVNKNISDSEAVSAYLEYLLGKEVQDFNNTIGKICGLPVVPLPVEDVIYDSETGKASFHGMLNVTVFADGTTSIHETNALLERCVPKPRNYEELENIIIEEITAYYEGDKSARDVAIIIDNRIQVYLDERN